MELLKIENKSGKVKLNDAIFKESVDKLLEEIGSVFSAKAVASGANFGEIMNFVENAADEMEFEIHSPGGSILEGYRVYQAIMDLRGRGVYVTAIINSLAASMGSVVAMAADKVKIVRGGRMMIHEASTATWGDAAKHANAAKLLDEMSAEIAAIYADRTGKDASEMRKRMKKETWMSAEDAVFEGFADEVISIKFDTKPKAEMKILDRITSPSSDEALAEIESLKNAAQAHDEAVAGLQSKLEIAEGALQTAATEAAEMKASLAARDERIAALQTAAETNAAEISRLTEAAAHTQEKVSLEAARIVAASGHQAPVDNPDEGGAKSQTKTRAEWNNLSAKDRKEFLSTGGKLTD